MKRIVAGLVVVGLVGALLMAPTPAEARWRGHGGGGRFVGGLAVGALTGVIIGGLLAPRVVEPAPVYVAPAPIYAPPPPVYAPAPVYVPAPAPVCSDYWVPDQYRGAVWVQGHWERYCQ
jgi:hypothetical protein